METDPFLWQIPVEPLSLPEDTIHVWRFEISQLQNRLQRLHEVLSSEEQERASRFVVEAPRRQLIVGRAMLRSLLGKYLDIYPMEIQLGRGQFDKPFLQFPKSPLRFNVSHSGNLVLMAFVWKREVGVDVEKKQREIEIESIANRWFTQEENSALSEAVGVERTEIFFDLWTRKEAAIKAAGTGLSSDLLSIAIPYSNNKDSVGVRLKSPLMGDTFWTVYTLYPGEGYSAALAVQGDPVHSVLCFQGNISIVNL